jgi:hypothetical protein
LPVRISDSVPSTVIVFWWVQVKREVLDSTTPTPAALSLEMAEELYEVCWPSSTTRTLTPAFSRATRSLTAVVSTSSYMVMSSVVVAELMKL